VAAVGRTGTLAFRVAYDAFGEARHLPAKDINGDGKVDSADTAIAQNASGKTLGQLGYNPDADWDRNGTVTSTDIAQFGSREYVAALPQGQLAQPGGATQPAATTTTAAANAARAANARSDFNIGFCGYRFNGDIGAYTVRFRHYDPTPGMCRWLERDPAGYQDGPSLYSYLGRNPMAGTDPSGRFLHVLAGAGIGAVIGGVTAAIMGEDILEGAAKGAVVGAVAGATFGAGLAIAGMKTTAAIVGSSAAAGMAGAAASAFVEGRAPTAEELVVGGVVGLAAPMLGQLVISMARHAIGNVRAAAQAGLRAVHGRRLPQSGTVARLGPGVHNQNGVTVLGHYPEYVDMAESLGARVFKVPEKIWNSMSPEQRWAANQRFLDRAMARGDEIVLATPIQRARPNSFFVRELEYLREMGYVPSIDGSRMIFRGCR
jgi:RHS repeat-associated protein